MKCRKLEEMLADKNELLKAKDIEIHDLQQKVIDLQQQLLQQVGDPRGVRLKTLEEQHEALVQKIDHHIRADCLNLLDMADSLGSTGECQLLQGASMLNNISDTNNFPSKE